MSNTGTYEIDWANVNLQDAYNRDQAILDRYTFSGLLLEVQCNIKDSEINEETIRKQFNESLQANMNSAIEIFENNLSNLTKYAQKDRDNV